MRWFSAYTAARWFEQHLLFAFGTWKIEVLGRYTSAIFLVSIAGLMLIQSVARLSGHTPIQYDQAILVAFLGLLVSLVFTWLLKNGHRHHHGDEGDNHHDQHHDLNLRAAYLHVITDALTSFLAIVALFGGKLWGTNWFDPVIGIVEAILVTIWAVGLIKNTASVLLDAKMEKPFTWQLKKEIQNFHFNVQVTDFHLWRVGKKALYVHTFS